MEVSAGSAQEAEQKAMDRAGSEWTSIDVTRCP
jgi:hypothetical protein